MGAESLEFNPVRYTNPSGLQSIDGQLTVSQQAELDKLVAVSLSEASSAFSLEARKAIANVTMNRVDSGDFGSFEQVIQPSQFNATGGQDYNDVFGYLESGAVPVKSKAQQFYNNIWKPKVDEPKKVLTPIYLGTEKDTTNGALHYYSPKTQEKKHSENPARYTFPVWMESDKTLQVVPMTDMGLKPTDDFRFFKPK